MSFLFELVSLYIREIFIHNKLWCNMLHPIGFWILILNNRACGRAWYELRVCGSFYTPIQFWLWSITSILQLTEQIDRCLFQDYFFYPYCLFFCLTKIYFLNYLKSYSNTSKTNSRFIWLSILSLVSAHKRLLGWTINEYNKVYLRVFM